MANVTRFLFLPALLLSGVSGCLQPDLPAISGAVICEVDSDCPEGDWCAIGAERCANASSDLEPPRIVTGSMETERAAEDGTLTVTFTADEELSEADVWYVRGADVVYFNSYLAEVIGSGTYGYTYQATGTAGDGNGAAKVMAVPRDLFGNWGDLVMIGEFELDNEGPALLTSGDYPYFSQLPASAGNEISFYFMADEELGTYPQVWVDYDAGETYFNYVSDEFGVYEYSHTVPFNTAAGAYDLYVVLVDTLGNESQWLAEQGFVVQ